MTIKTVDSKTLKKWLERDEAVVIDVREPEEHASCSIKGSVLMPASQVNAKDLAKFKNKKLVFHCKLGKRGAMACEKLAKEDPNLNVYNLEGGIDSWKQCGFKCEKGGSCGMTCHSFCDLCLDDQVRIIFGSIILLFIILGYYVSDHFFWITGVFAAFYIISGFTGMCMLRNYLKCLACNKGKDGGSCATTSCEMPNPVPMKTLMKVPMKVSVKKAPAKAASKPAVAKAKPKAAVKAKPKAVAKAKPKVAAKAKPKAAVKAKPKAAAKPKVKAKAKPAAKKAAPKKKSPAKKAK